MIRLFKRAWRLYRSDKTHETYVAVALALIGLVWLYWQTSHERR